MKLLSSIVLLSFLSMNEGQLRNVNINSHKQAPVSKGMESPVEVEGRSLRHYTQILDDNNDAAWERELGKKAKKGNKNENRKNKKNKKNKNKKNKKKKTPSPSPSPSTDPFKKKKGKSEKTSSPSINALPTEEAGTVPWEQDRYLV